MDDAVDEWMRRVDNVDLESAPEIAARLRAAGVVHIDQLRGVLGAGSRHDEDLVTTCCWMAGLLRDVGSTSALVGCVEDGSESEAVRFEAAKALGSIGDSSALPALMRVGSDVAAPEDVRCVSIMTASLLTVSKPDQRALWGWLARLAEAPHDAVEVRGAALEGLVHAEFRDDKRVVQLLSDPSPTVRFWACFALAGFGSRRAIRSLETLSIDAERVEPFGSVADEASAAIAEIRGRRRRIWRHGFR